jgi:hypothetical protein
MEPSGSFQAAPYAMTTAPTSMLSLPADRNGQASGEMNGEVGPLSCARRPSGGVRYGKAGPPIRAIT